MTASEALLECGAECLPVNVPAAAQRFGVKMIGYSDFVRLYDLDRQYIYENISYGGFSVMLEGSYICVINEELCGAARRRWTSAHELGHILSGHITGDRQCITVNDEREADCFAAEFLAPLTVLHFCGVSSALEVEELCRISHQAAEIRYRDLSARRRLQEEIFRGKMRGSGAEPQAPCGFLGDSTELALLVRFAPFIGSYLAKRSMHDSYEKYLCQLKKQPMAI